MKRKTTICIFVLLVTITHATNQVKDILVMNGDTLYLYNSPLEQIHNISQKISNAVEKKYKSEVLSSGCWRGFKAKWIVKDSTLYLLEVKQCLTGRNINKIVEQILGKKFKNGLLKADWVNGHFWSGRNFAPIFQLYISIFCNEVKLDLKNGHVYRVEEKNFKPCEYCDKNKIEEFILSHINWSKLPEISNRKIELSAYVENDKEGRIINVKIERSSDSRYDDEFLNAIRLLPCQAVYFNEGTFYDVGQTIELRIDENTKKKYAP